MKYDLGFSFVIGFLTYEVFGLGYNPEKGKHYIVLISSLHDEYDGDLEIMTEGELDSLVRQGI